jgi:hypothetical protein
MLQVNRMAVKSNSAKKVKQEVARKPPLNH